MTGMAAGAGMQVLGGIMTGIGAGLLTPNKVSVPGFPTIDPNKLEADTIAGQMKNLPAAQQLAAQETKWNQAQIAALGDIALGGAGRYRQMQDTASAWARGEMSTAEQNSILSSGAARALQAGFGGTGFQATGTMRMLRGEAAQRTQAGFGMQQQIMQPYFQSVVDPRSMFLSTQQRAQLGMWNAENQFQTQLMQAQIAAQPSKSNMMWGNMLMAGGSSLSGAGAGVASMGQQPMWGGGAQIPQMGSASTFNLGAPVQAGSMSPWG